MSIPCVQVPLSPHSQSSLCLLRMNCIYVISKPFTWSSLLYCSPKCHIICSLKSSVSLFSIGSFPSAFKSAVTSPTYEAKPQKRTSWEYIFPWPLPYFFISIDRKWPQMCHLYFPSAILPFVEAVELKLSTLSLDRAGIKSGNSQLLLTGPSLHTERGYSLPPLQIASSLGFRTLWPFLPLLWSPLHIFKHCVTLTHDAWSSPTFVLPWTYGVTASSSVFPQRTTVCISPF